MYRRLVTFLLLPALLLAQWVNGSRCMGGCQAASQDGRPHVHLNALLPGTPETKGCCCQRQAEQANSNQHTPAPLVSDSASAEQAPCGGSDDSILYLSFDAALGMRASVGSVDVEFGDHQGQQPAGLCDFLHRSDYQLNFFSLPVTLPRANGQCPVYIAVCALLI